MASKTTELDCLIIGAGFGGLYQLYVLRQAGLCTKVVDAASRTGGVWAWNRYPGARVDVEMPYYGYSSPAVFSTWTWSERYPGGDEILHYFDHVDQVWNLSKDIDLNVTIVGAELEELNDGPHWKATAADGRVYRARFLICATGTSFRQYMPTFEGIEKYKGVIHHSSLWPKEGVDLADKRVAVIGAGSTGVQVVQEAAKVSTKVTQFIRTPNIALPMRQRKISREEVYAYKPALQHTLNACRTTFAGLPQQNTGIKTFDISKEERLKLWEELWERGGFNWTIGGLADTITDKDANRLAYDYWVEKTRPRINDPKKRDLLVPLEPPYYLGTKRPSLENDYYEMCDRENVEITNDPITSFTETGISTGTKEEAFDIVAVCTGYDAVTGGLMTMNIKGENGVFLHEKWANGVATFLGLMTSGFPNMFMLYGPQAPTSLTNGPPFLELEGEWVREVIVRMREQKKSKIDAKKEKEQAWRDSVHDMASQTLAIHTNSWYMGANVPGKKREYLLYMGGLPSWYRCCQDAIKSWDGFVVS